MTGKELKAFAEQVHEDAVIEITENNYGAMSLCCIRGAIHEYQDRDTLKKYFSVSQVLTVLDPGAFKGIDPYVLAAAQDRGKDLHILFAVSLLSVVKVSSPPIRPNGIIGRYCDAIDKFIRERRPIPIRIEESSVNEKLGYAGTADTECQLDETPEHWIIDLKTGPERAVHSAQLIGGYKRLKGYEKAKRFGSLYIRRDGTYTLVEHTHNHVDQAWFDAGLSVLNGRRLHNIR